MPTPTSELVSKALNNDQKAYGDIVNRFRAQIFNFILGMVKNRAEAEDLTQESFIKAFKALDTFNSEYAFSTWLYKIAANNCIDHFRKRRLVTYSIDAPLKSKNGEMHRDFPDKDERPDTGLISKEKSIQIQKAIDSLPEKYRKAILLRHKEDRSYEEIAKELDIPLGTVKVRLFRAREMLKMKLREHLRP